MDDEALAVLAAEDRDAFAELYRRHAGLVTGFAARRAVDPDHLADVVSTVWLRVLERIRRYDPERGRFSSWLLGITANVVSEHRRDGGRRARLPLRVAGQRDLPPDERAALEDAIAASQVTPVVRAAMERLTPNEREILDLIAADVPYEEAAALLCVTPAALRMRVARARARLNALLDDAPPACATEGDPR